MVCSQAYNDSFPGDIAISGAMLNRWQTIVDLLAEVAEVPAALIMRVGKRSIEVFRTSTSKGNPYSLGATEQFYHNCGLYCEHVIRTNSKLLVPNALDDPDWKNNPDVSLNMIAYLGFPILFPDATPFGTICVLDSKTNSYSSKIESLMLQFRDIIEFQLAQLFQYVELKTELESYRISGAMQKDFPEGPSADPQEKLAELTKSLVRANQQLNNEIILRTQVERELTRAQQVAEASSKAKSEFLANMSHEIRTPLNGIMGMLNLLQETNLDEDQKIFTMHSIQATCRLTSLLSDILDLSRVEAGKLAIRPSPMRIRDCVSSLEAIFKPAAMEKNVEIRIHVQAEIPEVLLGDATRVQQVLGNVIGNAVKFTDKGFIDIDVYPLPIRKDDALLVLFTIADSGIGIPEDKLGIIFKAFEQQAVGYQRKNQGAGLGLAICKKLLELMGGSMTVESMEGIGSTFYCCLPFQMTRESLTPTPSVSGFKERRASILLVEDDIVSQIALKKYVQAMGLHAKAVANGKEALDALSQECFELVIMDIQMPELDGLSATRAIRQGKAGKGNADIPIIALTAYAMAGDKEKFLASGFNGYLSKPADKEALADLVHQLVSGGSA